MLFFSGRITVPYGYSFSGNAYFTGHPPGLYILVRIQDDAHAQYFLKKAKARGHTDNVIKAFDVPDDVAEKMKKMAVKQRDAKKFPNAPQIDDPSVSKKLGMNQRDVLGLKKEQIKELEKNMIPNTGRIL